MRVKYNASRKFGSLSVGSCFLYCGQACIKTAYYYVTHIDGVKQSPEDAFNAICLNNGEHYCLHDNDDITIPDTAVVEITN